MKIIFTLLASLLVAAVLVLAVARALSLCSDDAQGYERAIEANLDIAKTDMRAVGVRIGDVGRIQTTLQDLTPGRFAALRALNSQCRFLSRCLLFSFQRSAAAACPVEYEDYQASVRQVLLILQNTESLTQAVSDARAKADELLDARKNVAALDSSAGATGGRRTILLQREQLAEAEFSDSLSSVRALIEQLVVEIPSQE